MDRIIKITGKGRVAARPDRIRLELSLEGIEKKYDAAIAESAKKTEALQQIIVSQDFKKVDLKTCSFNISMYYEDYQDEKGTWKRGMKGYRYEHRMSLEFPIDNVRLGRLLYVMGQSDTRPQVDLIFTVSNREAVKEELLETAVADAKKKAQLLCKSAGVSLGELTMIDYSFEDSTIESRLRSHIDAPEVCRSLKSAAFEMNLEAADIVVEDIVTLTWNIGN